MGVVRRIACLVALVGAAGSVADCTTTLPPPMLRPAGIAPVGHTQVGAAIGAGITVTPPTPALPTRVGLGDVHLMATGRIGVGANVDIGVRAFNLGGSIDVGWRVYHGPHLDLLLDPSVTAGMVLAMDFDVGSSTGEGALTVPVVIDVPLGQSRLAVAPALVLGWSPGTFSPAIGAANLFRTPGFVWNPTLSVALDVPAFGENHLVIELDGSYYPDVRFGTGVGVATATLGFGILQE